MRLDELSFPIHLERRTTTDGSPGGTVRLLPILTLESNNHTDYNCLPKFVQTDDASIQYKNGQHEQQRFNSTSTQQTHL